MINKNNNCLLVSKFYHLCFKFRLFMKKPCNDFLHRLKTPFDEHITQPELKNKTVTMRTDNFHQIRILITLYSQKIHIISRGQIKDYFFAKNQNLNLLCILITIWMYSKNLFTQSREHNRLKQLFDLFTLHLQKDNLKQQKMQSPPQEIKQVQVKSLKKINCFESHVKSVKKSQKIFERSSQSSVCSEVLTRLATYANDKNSQAVGTKKYHWEQVLVSSDEKSERKAEKLADRILKNQLDGYVIDKSDEGKHVFGSFSENKQTSTLEDSFNLSRTKSVENSSRNSRRTIKRVSLESVKKSPRPNQQSSQDWSANSSSSSLWDFIKRVHQKQNSPQKFKTSKQSQKYLIDHRKCKNYIDENSQKEDDQQRLGLDLESLKKDQRDKKGRNKDLFTQQISVKYEIRHLTNYNDSKNSSQHQDDLSYNHRQSSSFRLSQYQYHQNSNLKSTSNQKKPRHKANQLQTFMYKDSSHLVLNNFGPTSTSHNKKRSSIDPADNSSYKPRRLKKAKQEETTCSICIDQIQSLCKLPCKHCFCQECLLAWLQKNSNCPNCRKSALYYMCDGQRQQIQQKQFQLEDYIDNVGGDDGQEDQAIGEELTYECYKCDYTQQGDQLLICDGCLVNAAHLDCDRALNGRMPHADMQWYCHVCRRTPRQWHTQARFLDV